MMRSSSTGLLIHEITHSSLKVGHLSLEKGPVYTGINDRRVTRMVHSYYHTSTYGNPDVSHEAKKANSLGSIQ